MSTGIKKAIKAMGSGAALARALGIDRASVCGWAEIPAKRIIQIERLTGVPREELRPDLYLAPRPPSLMKKRQAA